MRWCGSSPADRARRPREAYAPERCAPSPATAPAPGGGVALDDLVQDVYLHLFEHNLRILRVFDPDRGSLGAYLFRTAFHRAVDVLRGMHVSRLGVGFRPEDGGVELDPTAALEARDLLMRLLYALEERLARPADRLALAAIARGDLLGEVAQEHAMSPSYLSKCVWRVRRVAREWAEQNLEPSLDRARTR